MTQVLRVLNSKDLEKYIYYSADNLKEQRERHAKIVFQASMIIKNLYVEEGLVMATDFTND